MRLYNRNAELQISRVVPGSFSANFEDREVVTIRNLRIAFRAEKSLKSEPNKAEVTIYNLNSDSRAALQDTRIAVSLAAGYDGSFAKVLQGDLRFAQSTLQRTDWLTKLEIADGDRAFRHARVSRSYPAGTKYRQLVKDAAAQMQLALPPNLNSLDELDQEFASGVALTGRASDELTRALRKFDIEWSIQNGALQVVRTSQASRDSAIVVSESSGMIGVPEFGTPDKAGKKPNLTVQKLLDPQIFPGAKIELKARSINGFFKTVRVEHTGDTHGEQWLTTLELKEL